MFFHFCLEEILELLESFLHIGKLHRLDVVKNWPDIANRKAVDISMSYHLGEGPLEHGGPALQSGYRGISLQFLRDV